MLFHFIVVILWSHTKHDNKLIAMQATLSYACGISDIPLKGETIGQNLRQSKISGTDCFDFRVSTIPGQLQ